MRRYSEAAWERAMKVQEVILRAMAKRITWWQAAEILGISDRSLRRWKQRYEQHGYEGLFDRRRGRPSPKRVPLETVEEVLRLYQERSFDFNLRHFHEKLREEHGIHLSYTWVKRALEGAGLAKKGRKRGVHRKRRPRRVLPGMLLHLDGRVTIAYGPHVVGQFPAPGESPGGSLRTRAGRRRERPLALTSVALRAPSVNAKITGA